MLASSLTPEQTAIKMGLSEESIRLYLKILKKKFKTESRDQLMAMAGYLGLCDPYQKEPPEASSATWSRKMSGTFMGDSLPENEKYYIISDEHNFRYLLHCDR